jgi:membrane-associated phospholipid phosphatase
MTATQRRHPRSVSAALTPVDAYALTLIRNDSSAPLERAAVVLSHAGRGGFVWFALATLIGSGRRPLHRLEGSAISFLAIGSALGGSTAIARALGRPRPCEQGFRSLVPCPEGASFPSDQTAAAAAAVQILGWFAPSRRRWLIGTATTLALARVVAGVHYPTDVIAGGLIGASIGRAGKAVANRRSGLGDIEIAEP